MLRLELYDRFSNESENIFYKIYLPILIFDETFTSLMITWMGKRYFSLLNN